MQNRLIKSDNTLVWDSGKKVDSVRGKRVQLYELPKIAKYLGPLMVNIKIWKFNKRSCAPPSCDITEQS